jgi:hypothetical protein
MRLWCLKIILICLIQIERAPNAANDEANGGEDDQQLEGQVEDQSAQA